jgi:uncharacterized protein YqhQ
MATEQLTPRYGGRALRNGVMMVGPHSIGVAVRRPDGTIETAVEPFDMPGTWAKDIPFVRGPVSMIGMLKLARTASKLENRLNPTKRSWEAMLPQLAPGMAAAVADRLTQEFARRSGKAQAPMEALSGIALPFVAFGVSGQMPGVNELWRYHGAEHKAVNTAEAGLDLTPENAAEMSRVHPRCGTVFAFWGLVGGAVSRALINTMPNGKKKTIAGLLAGPAVLSAAYELLRLGAQVKDNPVGQAVFSPAWQSQRLTTLEPGREELEVALAALQTVIDFEAARTAS